MRSIAVLLVAMTVAPALSAADAGKPADVTLARNKAVARQSLEQAFGPHWRVDRALLPNRSPAAATTPDGKERLQDRSAASILLAC